ncbi:MAG: hypothetical protein H0T42_12535 [Deltaproteobacteria bacterium]|nr:hypothetical protein [Deltaproteobacteria bacterium]
MSRHLVIWIALAIGCRDKGLTRLEEIRATICACKTAECAEAAIKLVPAVQAKSNASSQKIAREMLDCLAKIYAKARPATGPDEPAPAP